MPGVNGVSRKVQVFEQLLEGVGDLDGAVVDIVGYVGMPTPGSAIDTSAVTLRTCWAAQGGGVGLFSLLAGIRCEMSSNAMICWVMLCRI